MSDSATFCNMRSFTSLIKPRQHVCMAELLWRSFHPRVQSVFTKSKGHIGFIIPHGIKSIFSFFFLQNSTLFRSPLTYSLLMQAFPTIIPYKETPSPSDISLELISTWIYIVGCACLLMVYISFWFWNVSLLRIKTLIPLLMLSTNS